MPAPSPSSFLCCLYPLFVFFLTIFSTIPLFFLYGNLHALHGHLILFYAWPLLGLALFLPAVCALYMTYLYVPRLALRIAHGALLLGLFFLVTDLFAPVPLGLLDGTPPHADFVKSIVVIEILIFLALFFFVVATPKSIIRLIARTISVSMAVLLVISLSAAPFLMARTAAPAPALAATSPASTQPNIYHIVLDEAQTDYFLYYLISHDRRSDFDGFVFFTDNAANYPYTAASVPSYLSGTLYESGDSRDWLRMADEGLFRLLSDKDYRLWITTKPSILSTDQVTYFYADIDLYNDAVSCAPSYTNDLVMVWLARLAPHVLTNHAIDLASHLQTSLALLCPGDGAPMTIEEGIEPYTGVKVMEHAIKREPLRHAQGEYVYIHPILPHGPYVMDSECRYRPTMDVKARNAAQYVAQRFYLQTICAGRLVIEFLDVLRQLDRYDESFIIIHSDHGSGWAGKMTLDGDEIGSSLEEADLIPEVPEFHVWSRAHLESRSMALLMMKTPGQSGSLRVSRAPTQLADVYPTIADVMGWEVEQRVEGRSVHQLSEGEKERERLFYYFAPGHGVKDDIRRFRIRDGGRTGRLLEPVE